MIVIDTSALMALLLGEASADKIAEVLGSEKSLSISAGTLAEALIVAERQSDPTKTLRLAEKPAIVSNVAVKDSHPD